MRDDTKAIIAALTELLGLYEAKQREAVGVGAEIYDNTCTGIRRAIGTAKLCALDLEKQKDREAAK